MMTKTLTLAAVFVVSLLSFDMAITYSQDQTPDQKQQPGQQELKRERQQAAGRNRGQGGLKIGDVAPTFKLKSLDGKSETDLASLRNQKPVVLFFGSYT